MPPRPFPKIPAKLLRDFSQYGSVFSIAAKCAEITRQRGLKKVDWQNPAKRKEVGCVALSLLPVLLWQRKIGPTLLAVY